MAWSADEDLRTRELSRIGVTLALRGPTATYGVAAFVLQLSVGFMALLWAAGSEPDFRAGDGTYLAIPALVAAIVASMTVGAALYHNEFSSSFALVLRTALVWAGVAALWPLATALPLAFAHAGAFTSVEDFTRPLVANYEQMLVKAWEGGIAGAAGAVAALLCVERRA